MSKVARTAKPRLRFPEFRDASAWSNKKLTDVCEDITQGGTPSTSKPEYWNGKINWLTPAEMGKSYSPFVSSSERKITPAGLASCSSRLLPSNSVIISTRAPIGHLAINTTPMAINQGCKGLIPGKQLDYNFLLATLFRSTSKLNNLGAGNTFKELSSASLKAFLIPVPVLAEQQKIADCLTSLDDVIAAQARKMEALKEYKRGLMQQLFPREGETVPRLRFPEFQDGPEWDIKSLKDVAPLQRGFDLPSAEIEVGDVPVVYSNGIRSYHNMARANGPGLITGRSGTIGRLHFINDGPYWPHNTALWVTDFKNNNPQFIYFLYDAIGLESFASGSGVPTLNRNDVHAFRARLPPTVKEQRYIATFLSTFDAQLTAEATLLDALKDHKHGLMQQLFPAPEAMGA